MNVSWADLKQELYPILDYENLCQRCSEGFGYDFMRQCLNFSMPALADFTRQLLGGDNHQRYQAWTGQLVGTFQQLHQAGVKDVMDLLSQLDSRLAFETFVDRTSLDPRQLLSVLKYLVYWVIPDKKYLRELIKADSELMDAINRFKSIGVRFNLDLLEMGRTSQGRAELAQKSGVPLAIVTNLVNRSDYSRLPWSSKATVSNYFGAGYSSLAQFAGTDLEQVSMDFYRYGESIGKNFKHGSEIDSSHRIARIVPRIIQS